MAFASDSTTAPAGHPRLLRAAPVPTPALTAETVAMLDAIGPELPTPPLLSVDTPEAVRSDLDALLLDAARTLHLRRQLAQAAEHGAALLASLGLPRLVEPGFVLLDRAVIGEAVDCAIATLDAMDGDTDVEDEGEAEPSLGWTAHVNQTPFNIGGTTDAEHDTADGEPSLASPERHPSPPEWAWDRVYTDRGPECSQLRWAEGARHDGEMVDEDGPIDEDELDGSGDASGHHDGEPSIGWPEDFTADVAPTLYAGADAEHDDVDLEGDSAGDLTWVFGPSHRGVAHV